MDDPTHRHPVVVVGGGVSGLSAAVALSASGIPVLLLEQRGTLGGRAVSYTDTTTGDTFDNGQHVLIAGYRRTMAFLDVIGSRSLVRIQSRPALPLYHPRKGFVEFRLSRLPSPLHLLWAALTTTVLDSRDRLPFLAAGTSLLRGDKANALERMTIEQWLRGTHQTGHAIQAFWDPLAVAIMNERIDRAPAGTFVRALREAFLGGWSNSALAIPLVGLSQLFAEPARAFIESHGGSVRCSRDVRRVLADQGRVSGIQLRDGSMIPCSVVILAVPAGSVSTLLPDGLPPPAGLPILHEVGGSPIVSVHLWFENSFMDRDILGLIGRQTHWIFRKPRSVSAVISAAYESVGLSNEALLRLVVEDLRWVYGRAVGDPYHSVVVREKRATVSLQAGSHDLRPGAKTAISGLFLAGDWTATGLPATIEGGIQSGETAAGLVVAFLKEFADYS